LHARMRVVKRGRDRAANAREAEVSVGIRAGARVLAPHDGYLGPRRGGSF